MPSSSQPRKTTGGGRSHRESPAGPGNVAQGHNGSMIGAVDNVLRLLRMLESQQLLRVNEVGRQMGLSRSTVHRMLTTLVHHGFVVQDPHSRGYGPGPTLVDLGLAVVHQMDIRQIARPSLELLRLKTNETVHLAVRRDVDVLYLDGLESERLVRAGQRIGQTLPAYATAAGRALLAQEDDETVKALYPDEALPAVTPHSIRQRSMLLNSLESVRQLGYAINRGESEEEISALAVAVNDPRGRPRAALVVTGPRSRADDAWFDQVRNATLEVCASLGEQLS